jgi:hypothetical protein
MIVVAFLKEGKVGCFRKVGFVIQQMKDANWLAGEHMDDGLIRQRMLKNTFA